jgi:DNA-binding PadR family transcriptional regulator
MFSGGTPRAERGEVRYLILDALKDEARHGYEIIRTIESRSGGEYRPSPGTVYPTLQMLEEMGHIQQVKGKERKAYELTEGGKAELEAHREEVEEAYERLRSSLFSSDVIEMHEMWEKIHSLFRSVRSSFRRGKLTGAKIRKIQTVISQAAEKIDRILRGD